MLISSCSLPRQTVNATLAEGHSFKHQESSISTLSLYGPRHPCSIARTPPSPSDPFRSATCASAVANHQDLEELAVNATPNSRCLRQNLQEKYAVITILATSSTCHHQAIKGSPRCLSIVLSSERPQSKIQTCRITLIVSCSS